MTRMFIPMVNREENLLSDLERKIDKLLELKKKRLINKEEFHQALLNIQEDIRGICTLDTIRQRYPLSLSRQAFLMSSKYPSDLIDASILEFEKNYAEYLVKKKEGKITQEIEIYYKDIDQKYLETKQALEELKRALPGLYELIADLENG